MTFEIHHGSRSHSMRGQNVLPTFDVTHIDELQPVLLRFGLATSDFNAKGFSRVEHVKQVASALVALRAAR
jgi:hypothetical protein